MADRGRPTLYTPELALSICERMAAGESLRSICSPDDMPDESTVRSWAVTDRDGFFTHYARACRIRAERWSEEIVEIADGGGDVQRDRLRVDTRKWLMSKLHPERYGDKTKLEHSGRVETPGLTLMLNGEPLDVES